MRFLKYFSILAVLAIVIYFVAFREERFQEINGKIFNTYYSIKIKSSHKSSSLNSKIQAELDKVNEHMSVFEPESEINRINEALAGKNVELSPEMSLIMQKSYNIYKISNGRFDPTIGHLIDLWGFGTKKITDFPTKEEVQASLNKTGFNKIKFSSDYQNLSKSIDDINVNLSAIAKGYGVDKVVALLKAEGYNDFVVEIGGEVYASGEKSETVKGWNVGIQTPNDQNNNAAVVTLKDMAVATSGDYRNYFYHNNKRYSHTIIPHTGYPAESSLASVSVFNKNCMTADGLATAIMSMGDKEGLIFANKNKIPAVLFIRNANDTFDMQLSDEAKKIIGG